MSNMCNGSNKDSSTYGKIICAKINILKKSIKIIKTRGSANLVAICSTPEVVHRMVFTRES